MMKRLRWVQPACNRHSHFLSTVSLGFLVALGRNTLRGRFLSLTILSCDFHFGAFS